MAIPNEEQNQFKPGQSGNPNGRPKKIPELDTLLSKLSEDDWDKIISNLTALAKKGNATGIRAAEVMMNRAYGQPKQKQEQENQVTVRIVRD